LEKDHCGDANSIRRCRPQQTKDLNSGGLVRPSG